MWCCRFCVDYFKPKDARRVRNSNGYWILTHFHADHYGVGAEIVRKRTTLCGRAHRLLVAVPSPAHHAPHHHACNGERQGQQWCGRLPKPPVLLLQLQLA